MTLPGSPKRKLKFVTARVAPALHSHAVKVAEQECDGSLSVYLRKLIEADKLARAQARRSNGAAPAAVAA